MLVKKLGGGKIMPTFGKSFGKSIVFSHLKPATFFKKNRIENNSTVSHKYHRTID